MPDPIRILLADDHPLFREGVALSLGTEPDFEVIAQTGSGEEAVELARRLRPDMALLDVEMAGMGGVAAAGKISASAPEIRIMMLTVSENRENLLAALKVGAHGYVLKGVSASDLRAIVRRVAGGEAYVTPALAADMLTDLSRPQPADPLSELTAREAEILKLLSQGLTNKEIGDAMFLAEKTVKHYMTNILHKLHVRSRTEAALIAQRGGKSERTGK